MELPQPYLLFLGDVTEPAYAKTAFGLRDWARERCIGEWSCSDRAVTQRSLSHPSYSGVSLGLLHGSQPDVIVVCHEPGREYVVGHPQLPLPSIEETIELNLALGRRTNPGIRCGGVSLNTSRMGEREAARVIEREAQRLGLPGADPVRGGQEFDRVVDSCLR